MGKHDRIAGNARVARHRAAMRAQGLRLKQIWVPDMRLPEVREQIRREAEAIAASPTEAEDQAFIDAISLWDELPPYEDD